MDQNDLVGKLVRVKNDHRFQKPLKAGDLGVVKSHTHNDTLYSVFFASTQFAYGLYDYEFEVVETE